ncbi:DNase I-like protein [Hyaloraphidium curvatum]|nr:DNase I-like protein [Hyaloraphidium curvatum]
MRIVSWNVNSLATVRGYNPWRGRSWREVLDALDADVVCFQETKISRATAANQPDMVLVPGYDAFFSFCRQRVGGGGYSGVATYVRTERVPPPVEAEEGFLNVLGQRPQSRIGHWPDLEADFTREELEALDSEGRCLVTDHHLFVLFNVYFPNDATDERHVYKMKFYRAIEARVRALLAAGRHVVVVGDVNTTHEEIDHADPKKSMKELGIESYGETPSRRWIHALLHPRGPMVDVFRRFHPDRTGAFTCWNTKIDARPANYGTRLDYVLASVGLAPAFCGGDVHQDVMGSDHCPVSGTMRDEVWVDAEGRLVEGEGPEGAKLVRLADLMEPEPDAAPRNPPALCTRFWEEFSGKQKKLSTFFSAARPEADKAAAPDSPVEETPGDRGGSQTERPTYAPSAAIAAASAPAKQERTSWTSPSSKAAKKAAPKKKGSAASGAAPGQKSLLSFLAKPASAPSPPSVPSPQSLAPPPEPELPVGNGRGARSTGDDDAPSAEPTPSLASPHPPHADLPPDPGFTFESNEPVVKTAWNALFQPRPAPLCHHGEPTKEWVTGKPGPNKGRAFYLCQRPVGPEEEGTQKGVFGAKKGPGLKIGQFRCDFFEWKHGKNGKRRASDVPEDPKRGKAARVETGSSQEEAEPDWWPSDVEM